MPFLARTYNILMTKAYLSIAHAGIIKKNAKRRIKIRKPSTRVDKARTGSGDMISLKHFHPLRRIFYVFKNTFNTDTNFRVFFFWYSVAEGEFIE